MVRKNPESSLDSPTADLMERAVQFYEELRVPHGGVHFPVARRRLPLDDFGLMGSDEPLNLLAQVVRKLAVSGDEVDVGYCASLDRLDCGEKLIPDLRNSPESSAADMHRMSVASLKPILTICKHRIDRGVGCK